MNISYLEEIKKIGFDLGSKILLVLVVLLIGFKLTKIIEKRMTKNKSWIKVDPTLQSFLRSFLRIGLKLLVIVTAIYTAGVEMTTFVAIIGAAGLAIGLALQGSLSNLAGGVLIVSLRPFRVGDYIEGVGQGGTVTDIGLFYTNLRTPDNKAIVIPNANIANSSLTNYGIFPTRRVDLDIPVSYKNEISHIKKIIHVAIDQNPLIIREPAPFVRLWNQGETALNFKVRVWVKSDDYWDVYFDLTESIKVLFDENDVEIMTPHLVFKQKMQNPA